MHKVQAERQAEQFADEMSRCPGSWGSKIVLAGMGFDEADEVPDRLHRQRRMNCEHRGCSDRTTFVRRDGRICRLDRRVRTARSPEQAASDRFAPARYATRPGARQRPLPDAKIDGAAGSWRLAPRQAHGKYRA